MTDAIDTKTLALAAEHAELLRAVDDNGKSPTPLTKTELAGLLKRDPSNLNKTLKVLAGAGLAHADASVKGLPDAGVAALAALDRAAGGGEPGSPPGGTVALLHRQIIPDPNQARKDWESADAKQDLAELADDVVENGVLQNLLVRRPDAVIAFLPDDPATKAAEEGLELFMLDGGERRWRAVGLAIADGRWPADRPIDCRVIEGDDLHHQIVGLAENLQRRSLNPIEKAKAFEALAKVLIAQGTDERNVNSEIARRVKSTPEHVQQHRRFLKLTPADQDRMILPRDDDQHLSVREARRKLANMPQAPDLTPEERLLFAEIAYRVYVEKKSRWDRVEINPAPADDPAVKSLVSRSIIHVSDTPKWDDARFYAGIQYHGQNVAEVTFPWLTKKTAAAKRDGLTDLQREILGADAPVEGGFANAWLNGPYELSEEGKTLLAQREQREAEAEKARETQAARAAEDRAKLAAICTTTREVVARVAAAGDPPPPIDPEFGSVLGDLNHPLPWTPNDRGELIDAAGGTVFRIGNYYGEVNDRQLAIAAAVALAANSAGGVAMPPAPATPERSMFEAAMVGRLQALLQDLDDEAAAGRATQILDEFLEDNGVAFGADDWDWSPNGAIELVNDHLQIDEAA